MRHAAFVSMLCLASLSLHASTALSLVQHETQPTDLLALPQVYALGLGDLMLQSNKATAGKGAL